MRFWRIWNNVQSVDDVREVTYQVFKDGIEPKWEDPQNAKGGEYKIVFNANTVDYLGDYYMDLTLALIGEQLGDHVCGIVCAKKKFKSRIVIWVNTTEPAALAQVRRLIAKAVSDRPNSRRLCDSAAWCDHAALLRENTGGSNHRSSPNRAH